METIKSLLEPLTRDLPQDFKDFLDGGGWWLVLAILALLALLVLWLFLRLLGRLFFGRSISPQVDWDREQRINLAEWPPPAAAIGNLRLTVFHLSARLRLVVLAAPGKDHLVDPTAIERILDLVVPGLGAVASAERPLIRIWPAQLSYHGFGNTFQRVTIKAEPEEAPSRWVLLAGRAQIGRQPIMLGLGLWTDQPNVFGRRLLEAHEWLGILRVEKTGG